MSMTMTVSGAGRSIRFDWAEAAAAWASKVGPVAQNAIKLASPVGLPPGAGTLRDSVSTREETSDGAMSVVVYTTVPYAPFVIGGAGPHVIAARNARALHWVDATGNRFAKSVNHPGNKANAFPERGLTPFSPLLAEYFSTCVQEAMETA